MSVEQDPKSSNTLYVNLVNGIDEKLAERLSDFVVPKGITLDELEGMIEERFKALNGK